MRILVMGSSDARDFIPTDLTYAIRIINPQRSENKACRIYGYLQDSPLYKKIIQYSFDAFSPEEIFREDRERYGFFDEEIAKRIIDDFRESRGDCKTLLVHCLAGENRSPAIAMGLNDIFNLEEDTEKLRKKYPKYCEWIYNIMMEVGSRYGLSQQMDLFSSKELH